MNYIIDNSKNYGENLHSQESWESSNFNDSITKLYFQLVRQPKNDFNQLLLTQYENLIKESINLDNQYFLQILISLLFQTRDINSGKGEYCLFYNLLPIWDKYYSRIDTELIRKPLMMLFDVKVVNETYIYNFTHPYGSWKDLKYIFNSYRNYYKLDKKDIIEKCEKEGILNILLNQVKLEWNNKDSLLFKWLPREKSKKFGWQASLYAKTIWPNLTIRESLLLYRKHCSNENKKLETLEINQCNKTWAWIDFEKQLTSLNLIRQKKAFLCKSRNMKDILPADRLECKSNFLEFLSNNKEKNIKTQHISLGEIIKNMIHYININDKELIDTTNIIWENKVKSNKKILYNIIPILDLSLSMTSENSSYYEAIGIALWLASNSSIENRIMIIGNQPYWLNINDCKNLKEMVELIQENVISGKTNIYAVFKLIADICILKDLPPEKIENLKLIILSDMQIDKDSYSDYTNNRLILEENIKIIFAQTGIHTSHNIPYNSPTLFFWNMRTTNGFPCSTCTENVFMISGFNPNLISNILTGGTDKLSTMTAASSVLKILLQYRYSWFWI